MLYHRAWARLLQRDRPAAEGLFAQSIAMYRRLAPDTDFPDLAWPLNHYGFALLSDRPAEAIPLLEEAWAIRRRILPRGAYWRMVTGLNLGMAYANATEYDKAEPLFLEAHRVVLESYGAGSEFARSSARRLSDLYTKMGRVAEAAKYGADRRPAGGERK
jgi:tetratricopeptide (TPR) repeat protein